MTTPRFARGAGALLLLPLLGIVPAGAAAGAEIEVFHADSLAGPMRELRNAFVAQHPGVAVNLTSGVSKQLAERIVKGERCDVFAPSSPAVIDDDLMGKPVAGGAKTAAQWYVVFSANEMAIVTAKGNPLGIRAAADLARPDVRFVRINGEKDLATGRTLEFLKRATQKEGKPALAQAIADRAPSEPGKAVTVPDAVAAVRQGRADAAVVYLSAAVAARGDVEIVRFADDVNLSEAIRNAATVPGTAVAVDDAIAFVAFLLSPQARRILADTGQPPVTPALRKGAVPAAIR